MEPVPEVAERLLAWASEAGFDRAGIAALAPPLAGGAALRRWLARGDHAAMAWMAQRVEERCDPDRLLPGARSALCVALRYAPRPQEGSGAEARDRDLWPHVARYARGRDYHNLLGKRLKSLARRIRAAYPGSAARPWVDTGPVLERELAARAGLGTIGKNTCLLSRDGSYFLLGEILTRLDLPSTGEARRETGGPGGPLAADPDLCGRCTRCLDACPTGALPEPFRLDARRCISYWTIEHRGPIPPAVRPGLGRWVFGCDICQEVCPWNERPAQPAAHPDLALAPERAALDLEGLLALDAADYSRRMRGSALQRARRQGLRRNAAVAMGNRRDPRHVPALSAVLAADDDPVVRGHAAWALGRIGGAAARAALLDACGRERDADVGAELAAALAGIEQRPIRRR